MIPVMRLVDTPTTQFMQALGQRLLHTLVLQQTEEGFALLRFDDLAIEIHNGTFAIAYEGDGQPSKFDLEAYPFTIQLAGRGERFELTGITIDRSTR